MARYRRRHDRHQPRTWFSLFVTFGGWAALGIGALVVVITLFSAGALGLAARFDRDGALAYAVVSDKRMTQTTDSKGNVTRDYFVVFAFKVRGGTGQRVETEVPAAYFHGVDEGEERPIRYLRSDPTTVESDIGYYRRTGLWLRWLGLVLGLAGLAALWRFGARANRAVKVRRDGEKRYARVTGIREVKLLVKGAPQGRLVWREEDGQVGESLLHNAEWLRGRYAPGEPVVVFRHGRHAFWEGDVGPPKREVAGS